MNTGLVRFTKWLLDIMFYVGMMITVLIPMLFHFIGDFIVSFRTYYVLQCVLYVMSGVLCLLIVHKLRKMFKTVLMDDAFVEENAVCLKKIGKYSFLISILSLIRLPLSPTPSSVVVLIVFSIAGLFSIVLCQVFERAVQYKRENDLTI